MKLSHLKAKEATLHVPVPDEEPVAVKYKPGELTVELQDRIREFAGSGEDAQGTLAFLLPLISWWDIEDDDGNNVPVSDQTMRIMPMAFLGGIITAMFEDALPNASRPVISDGPSSPEDSQDGSRTGIGSFELPTV